MGQRLCFALDLVSDRALIEEYVRIHEPGSVWPTIIDHIRAKGAESMEIWHRGDRLFMIIEAADDYPRGGLSDGSRAESERWEAWMGTFQRALPDAAPDEKWSPMRRIFCLADHVG
jgi:L-rhamnose mutarotase